MLRRDCPLSSSAGEQAAGTGQGTVPSDLPGEEMGDGPGGQCGVGFVDGDGVGSRRGALKTERCVGGLPCGGIKRGADPARGGGNC